MYRILFFFFALILIFTACKKEPVENNEEEEQEEINDSIPENEKDSTLVFPCNGDTSLCDQRYNEISYATTHNAHAVQGEFNALAANQDLEVTAQLELGIRCLNFKSYWTDDNNCGPEGHYLYHGIPLGGCVPLAGFLSDIKTWLDGNPYEVITFTIEPGASVGQLDQSFTDAGLKPFMYQHTFGEEWPTLKTLIESEKRLIVFTNKGSDNENYEGFHDYWNYTFDTDYRAKSRSDFDCDKDRGNANGDFFLLNHFLTNTSPQPDSAAGINDYSYLLQRAELCTSERGKQPNFVMVDFAGQGNLVDVVNTLNEQ
ncbi:MAG: hypothetical protein WD334_07660 [Chitinophagales bacterium]